MEFRTFPSEAEENAEKRRRHFDKSKKLQAKAEKLLAESVDEAALYEKLTKQQAEAEQLKKSTGAKPADDEDVSMADDESNVSHAVEMIATLEKPEHKEKKKDKKKEKKDKSKKPKTSTLPEMATILAEAIDEALPTISAEQQLLSEAESAIDEKRKKKSKKEKKDKSSKADVTKPKASEEEPATLPQEPEKKKRKRGEAAIAEPEAQPDKKAKKDKKEKSKSKKAIEEPQAPADAEKWNVDELEGGAARQSKFLRLLGAKKQGIDADKTVGARKSSKSDATQAEADIQRQYERGMMKKNDGGGHRRGLGA